MGIETSGRLHLIYPALQVSERFTKREFVVEIADNPKYPQMVLFQLTGDRCDQLNDLREGDHVAVEFSLRGREWKSPKGEVKYFNSLDAWKVIGEKKQERSASGGKHEPPAQRPSEGYDPRPAGGGGGPDDDIPFLSCELAAEPSPIARVLR